VTAARAGGAYIAAELVPGNADPTLLPRTLRAAQRGRPTAQTITLAGQPAYRYDGLRGRGSVTNLRVYTVLTSGGVATLACGPSAPARDCDRIAGTLKLASAQALPAGPSTSYAATLKKTFTALDARGRAAKTSLGKAGTVTAQAAALRQLASAYENAAAPGGALNVRDSGLNARLASLFKSVASAYGRLELAVQGNDAAGLARAQHVLKRLQARRARAAAALASVGYPERPPRIPVTTVSPLRGSAPPMSGSSVTPPPPGAAPPVTPRQVTPQPVTPAPRNHRPPPPPSGGGGTIG
jgi:hypothetical protein